MPEIFTKVKNNMRDRINAVPLLVTKPIDTVMEAAGKLVHLEPVKAITHLAEHAGDGAVGFVNSQADITRRWIG